MTAYYWDPIEYPVCGGDGWTAALLILPVPDHAYEDDPETPGRCTCGHTAPEHVEDGPGSDVHRIYAVRVLNMTTANHRVTVGDARTSVADAWTSPWMVPDAEIDGTDYPVPAGTWLYATHSDVPYRVRCS